MAGPISKEFGIKEKNTQGALDKIQKMAQAGLDGNMEVINREIRPADARILSEKKIYYDSVNDRVVINVKGKLKKLDFEDLT